MTGFESSRSAISSIWARRLSVSSPSTSSSKRLPWRTSVTPSRPSRGRAPWTALPWGSRISGFSMTLTTTRGTAPILGARRPASDQLALEDLAGSRHRQRVAELDDPGALVGGHLLPAPGDQVVLGDLGARLSDDEGLDLLAEGLVRDADHGRQGDRLVGEEHLLDLAGVHVEAAADDHVLGPVDDVVVAVLVTAGQVAGAEPAVPHDLRGRLRSVVVALHDVVPADRYLPDRVRPTLDVVPLGVDELHLDAPDRVADRAGLRRPVGLVEGRDRRGLREPVALEDRDAEAL